VPEIELFNSKELWVVVGPFIITGIVILIAGLIGGILVVRLEKGLVKELMKIIFLVFIIFIAYITLQLTSTIWGN
jgi:hypothetical protein